MTSPDARPGTEGAGETAERGILCAYCGDYATYATTDEAALEAARQTMIAHDAVCPRNPLVTRIRELESAAEARAALLRDAPAVWVATDGSGSSFLYEQPPLCDSGERVGEEVFFSRHPSMPLPNQLTPPGTVRRYALVPHPEGEET